MVTKQVVYYDIPAPKEYAHLTNVLGNIRFEYRAYCDGFGGREIGRGEIYKPHPDYPNAISWQEAKKRGLNND